MIIAILQARMSSTRLPGKVFKPILGKPMVWHQWLRMKRSKLINQFVLATSVDFSDDQLVNYFQHMNEQIYRGSLNDVLDRYYKCTLNYKAEHIVRLTADCPLIDPDIIDQVITTHLTHKNDYTAVGKSFPDGLDVEVMRFDALEKAYLQAKTGDEREHVTQYIYKNPNQFKLGYITYSQNLAHHRWTVDHPEDFELIDLIYNGLFPTDPNFNMQDILDFLNHNPHLLRLNKHLISEDRLNPC